MKIKRNNRRQGKLFYPESFEELKKLIEEIGGYGEWKKCSDMPYQFTNVYGACFNWWSNTGTVTINGNKKAANILRFKFLTQVSKKHQKIFHPDQNNTTIV